MRELRLWWIPQIPMGPFHVEVDSVEEAKKIYTVLAEYDLFQFNNNIKPDYSNAGGLEVLTESGEWEEWEGYDGNNLSELLRDEYCAEANK